MSKRAEKAISARARVIKLCWPLSFALTLLFCTVLLVLFTKGAKPYSGKQTVHSSIQCDKDNSFCQVQHLYVTLRSLCQIIIIIMYIYHALINALSAHMIHINLNMIFYTHVKHSPTKTIYIKYYLK